MRLPDNMLNYESLWTLKHIQMLTCIANLL